MFVEEKKQGEVTEAPAKTLKLSEAIRVGARLRPQCRASFFNGFGSCALGAAMEALLNRPTDRDADYVWLCDHFPELKKQIRTHRAWELGCEIVERNDGVGYTREQIADWLEAHGY